ncbi:DUF2306 domain-containing protein [Arthrobacter sp. JZ12]|uniref:DUF2306 domain-containing protein n=1 Tax=Arthrobacter sp. JZ12 TaxID=2654190 RepID=UPI002B46440A|nr:DUF2306 domain-containing protein [Arthrobacter sp. JZ12]WRH25853.1 DUF2306 domain-containing protein [Arthrobacter sp. JZ12]
MATISQGNPATPVFARPRVPGWLIPAGLISLSLIPVLAGAARLGELTGGAPLTEQNARFFESPVPVVAHIVAAVVYSLLGAFQFSPSLRGRRSWHRIAGKILIPAGLLSAISGLWMTLFYTLPPSDGQLLLSFRLFFGFAMTLSLILGVRTIIRRDFSSHGAWMTRAYATGLGAGTQALILIGPELVSSPPDVTTRALLMGAGWALNLSVAEYFIRRR